MLDREYTDILHNVLTQFNRCAPTGQTQRAMTDALHELRRMGCSDRQCLVKLAFELHKGLSTGDWIK